MALIRLAIKQDSIVVSNDYQQRYAAAFETAYNTSRIEIPLCIFIGPFPFEAKPGKPPCEACADLVAAGLATQDFVSEGNQTWLKYDLTETGRSLYTEDVDPDRYAEVQKRYAASGRPDQVPDLSKSAYAKPRLCFGKERFHHIADALPPMNIGGSNYISVKLVSEARELNPIVWSSAMAGLTVESDQWEQKLAGSKLLIPPMPEPGQPALYPPQVVTFLMLQDGTADIDPSMRYGAWVDEK